METSCAARHWRCSVIGGLAVQRWGEPRQTRDVNLTILTGLGGEERYVDPVLAAYRHRIPDARRFALERRVLLVETSSGVPLDISLGGLPFESRMIDRSSALAVGEGAHVTTSSAEDLVVLKAFADRVQDWLVEGIIVRQASALDRQQILAELRLLLELKEDDTPEGRLVRWADRQADT